MPAMLTIGSLTIRDALLLAPMEDVTCAAFRRICRRYGADLVYSEFVSAQALVRSAEKSIRKLRIGPGERPMGIQIFGETVEAMVNATRVALEAEPDLIDINIGCPVRKVVCKGAGAALLKDLNLAEHIARGIVAVSPVPVTAKARIGWDAESIRIEELAKRLEGAGVQALAIHARTRSQAYGGRADWRWIARAKRAVGIPIIGNGDVRSPEDARRMFDETGCDAVMIGRAAIGAPWIFRACRRYLSTGVTTGAPDVRERVGVLLEHLDASVEEKGETRGVREMRRQFGPYLKGLRGVSRVRSRLMQAGTVDDVREILNEALRTLWTEVA